MAKLRDWWPATDERSPTPPAPNLRLSDVTAALNSLPPPSPPLLSRPVVRLGNSDDHKQELIRALLGRSAPSPSPPKLCLSDDDPDLDLRHNAAAAVGRKRIDRDIDPLDDSDSAVAATDTKNIELNHRKQDSSNENGFSNMKRMKRIDSSDSISLALRLPDPPPLRLRPTSATSPNSAPAAQQSAASDSALEPLAKKENHLLSRREIHIFSERQRRKGMTHLYATLHSLLPDAKPKTDRCTVLTEAMEYIQGLQTKVEELGKQKAEILTALGESLRLETGGGGVEKIGGEAAEEAAGAAAAAAAAAAELSEEVRQQILAAADVVVRFCGRDAFITLNSPKRGGVWSAILQILHSLDMELLNVTLSTSNDMDYHCIHAKIAAASDLRSRDLQRTLQDLVLSHAVSE